MLVITKSGERHRSEGSAFSICWVLVSVFPFMEGEPRALVMRNEALMAKP